MPFSIVRNDITAMAVDAIVNTANPRPVIGLGVDSAIHEKAGPKLLSARQQIGPIACGSAAITDAYDLPAKYVIHTVGPVWMDGTQNEEILLQHCYENSLRLALEQGCASIAFPLISTGTYGFPKDKALQIAIRIFSAFLLEHDIQIYLVVFDSTSYRLSEKLFQGVEAYIDENYVGTFRNRTLTFQSAPNRRYQDDDICEKRCIPAAPLPCASGAKSEVLSLEEMFRQADAGFTETLLKMIDKSGHKDATIYKRAGLSKQHFSKIRNNPNYKPTKPTAIALALALELNEKETNDLIGRAGFTLSNSSKFDLIIRYFIEHRNFNVVEINLALYEFDQPLLGS